MHKSDNEGPERTEGLLAARQEFLQLWKRGAEFTEQLLKENERLRFRVAELEARVNTVGGATDDALVRELVEKVQRLEAEKADLLVRHQQVEQENKDFTNRYVEIEAENSTLMNIYVASYQLHSTLDFQEVLQAITEVVLNFIGAEVFAVAVLDERTRDLRVQVAEGLDPDALQHLQTTSPIVAQVMESGEPYFVGEIEGLEVNLAAPAICIPLRIKQHSIGAIVIYKFLQQKKRLASVDHELFTLLAGHAATAIFAAKLYTDSKRKLNTIQGFIDLVTSSG